MADIVYADCLLRLSEGSKLSSRVINSARARVRPPRPPSSPVWGGVIKLMSKLSTIARIQRPVIVPNARIRDENRMIGVLRDRLSVYPETIRRAVKE